jgi:acyl-CoA thioester hydrolase
MAGPRAALDRFPHRRAMGTRWRDNDAYGHMNNVVFYEFFDTVVNLWLIEDAGLPVPGGDVVGLVVETGCTFHASLGWPHPVIAGLRVDRLGRTSIAYGIGLFREGEVLAAAEGRFTHVYVDAATRQPVPLPAALRAAAAAIAAPG